MQDVSPRVATVALLRIQRNECIFDDPEICPYAEYHASGDAPETLREALKALLRLRVYPGAPPSYLSVGGP